MLDFNHPNVLTLLGVCFDTEHQLPLIILPYMANGDLKSYLRSERKIANCNDEFPEVCIIEVTFNLHYPSLGYTGFQRGFSNENLCLNTAPWGPRFSPSKKVMLLPPRLFRRPHDKTAPLLYTNNQTRLLCLAQHLPYFNLVTLIICISDCSRT